MSFLEIVSPDKKRNLDLKALFDKFNQSKLDLLEAGKLGVTSIDIDLDYKTIKIEYYDKINEFIKRFYNNLNDE